ncbi:MAG: alpha/beta fold hydrolase [Lentisphaerae bacterium]|nr:alpha/beta fold hydrolase [Lentisphaerota bacterium]
MKRFHRAGVVAGLACSICFGSIEAQEGLNGRWDGAMSGDSIGGSFAQAGYSGTFSLSRAEAPVEDLAEAAPPPPLPYAEEEVTFRNGDVTLAGTLTIPPSGAPSPAVVMITGSGPQNRDEELFGFKPFRIIADHFTRNGIAVLRYDDRGIGGSTGNVSESTSEDFAMDVLEAVRFLQARDDIAANRIGLVGHSEGGIVAPIVAANSDAVALIILMAGTAVTGEEILFAQGEAILSANGATEAQLRTQRETQRQMFEVIRTGEGMEELEADLREQVRAGIDSLPADQRAAITDVDAAIDAQVNGQLGAIGSRWFRFFLDYDPATALEQVDVPVLALFGGLDLQVPPDVNREPMERALERSGNSDVTMHTFPMANHLFLTAVTGSPNEYPTMDKVFVPGFLEMMTEWILGRVGRE